MGNIGSAIYNNLSDLLRGFHKEARIVMLGLDGAGKTTVLYNFKLGEAITTIPTIGFNVETVQINKVNMTMWDVGGQNKIRPLWRHYYDGAHALVWVVDCADYDRYEEAKDELKATLRDMPNVPVLVLANKADLRHVTSTALSQELHLDSFMGTRKWYVQETCAIRGDGLHTGMQWLCDQL